MRRVAELRKTLPEQLLGAVWREMHSESRPAILSCLESFSPGLLCTADHRDMFLMKFAVDSTQPFLYQPLRGWRGGRVVEGAPLLREYTS